MNKTILAAAILAMAAFAGVMIVGDDTDAALATSITYEVGSESTVRSFEADATTFVAPSPSDLGFDTDKDFLNWKVKNGSAIYRAGMEYAIPETQITLVAEFDTSKYVTLVIGEESFKCIVKEADKKIDTDSEQYKAAETAVKAIDLGKFRLNGWYDSKDDKKYDETIVDGAGYLAKIAAATFEGTTTLTLKTTAYFQISFIVEGVQIVTLASDELADKDGKYVIPVAPSKENHVFSAWTDKTGAEIITYTVDGGYKPVASELKFTEDTALYAKFVPNNMTVTFQVGEFTSTQTVLYGEKAMKPELPAGYIAWMLGEKEFDFETPITENITIVALEGEPTTIYAVTFEIEGQTPVKLDSENYKKSIPDTAREGYAFQGWVVKGASQYVDPLTYEITGDITFVAVYKEVAPPEPEQPKFYQTPLGQCAIILAVFVVGLVFYGIFTGRINVPKFKISRVEKAEEPAVEQVEEEKKP